MKECIDSLGEAVIVSIVVANSGYRQDEIDEAGRIKTDFISQQWSYWIIRTQSELRNDPCTFQRTMQAMLLAVR